MNDSNTTQNTKQILDELQEAILEVVKEREDIQRKMKLVSKSSEEETDEEDETVILKEQEEMRKQLDDDLNNLFLNSIIKEK